MEEKINARMLLIGILSMILTGALMLSVFHKSFVDQVESDLKLTAVSVATGYENIDDHDTLSSFAVNGLRITLISPDGSVLYESNIDKTLMGNHLQREEVQEALASGAGESVRQSGTLGINTYYYAMKVSDGNVLRISMDVMGMYSDYNKAAPMVVVIAFLIMTMSVVLSQMLTKNLVEPIEAMAQNLDNIDKDVPYKELEPFALAVKEQQIKKAEIAKMRQEFTANVSHELKTPLTSISGYAEMIVSGMAKEEDVKTFAGKIHAETGRLIDLIGDILNLSELDDPDVQKKIEPVDLYQVALNTSAMLSLKASESEVNITVEGGSSIINGNKMMLEELVYNLCDNAIRYNKKGGTVKMYAFNYVDKVIFTVIDDGIGISKEHQERVFERFYRVDKSRSKATGGTGLGLAIVKHIVMQHDGKITVESNPGEGTRMNVIFKKPMLEDV